MNSYHQQQLPNDTDNLLDKQILFLIESQEHLTHLRRSVNESKKFNKRALEFLVNSMSYISPDLSKHVANFAATINLAQEEAHKKEAVKRERKIEVEQFLEEVIQ